MSQSNTSDDVRFYAENIGGLATCEVDFEPGVTVLEGRNATGRTSLLTGIAGALGGSAPSLRSDADDGVVELQLDGRTNTRTYERTANGVRVTGTPLTERDDLVDLFVCLTESNPARRAIVQDGNLREIIMRPVDTGAVQRRIEELQSKRNQLGRRIREIEDRLDSRPQLETRCDGLERELEDVQQELADLREHLEEFDTSPDEAEAVEEALRSLEERNQELTSVQNRIQTQQDTITALKDEQRNLQTEADSIEASEEEFSQIETTLSELTTRERSLATTINDLSAIVDFNADLVSGDGLTEITGEEPSQSPAAKLNPMGESVHCWTCGSQVQRSDIADRLDELRRVVDEKRQERSDVQSRIEELRSRKQTLQEQLDRQAEVERQLTEINEEIDRREASLESLRAERADIRDRLAELEAYVEERENIQERELVEQYQRVSELEYERGQLEEELAAVREKLAELDRLDGEYDQLQAQQQEVRDELASERTQIRDLETTAIEAFNEHMAEVLDILAYQNIARVWIERKEGAEFESSHGGYRGGSATQFDLHVVRETEDGSGYEDSITNLSESEREVIGLVVALAGYLVHDVHEVVPVMLLDSLEAIDSERIAALIDYFAAFVPYLFVALLPEDAAALPVEYSYVTADELTA